MNHPLRYCWRWLSGRCVACGVEIERLWGVWTGRRCYRCYVGRGRW